MFSSTGFQRRAAGVSLLLFFLWGLSWLSYRSNPTTTPSVTGQSAIQLSTDRARLSIHGKLRGMQRKVQSIEWFAAQRTYPHGTIPFDAEIKAVEYVQQRMIPELQQMQLAKGASSNMLGQSITWTPRGPGNLGGRIRGLVADPTNAAVIYAGSVSGGVWKTTNGGATWTPLMDAQVNMNVSAVVMKPGDPNTLYAGTGEGFFNSDALPGRGVFKTTDGGQTWTRLHVANGLNTSFITELAISPANPSVIYASGRRTYPVNNIAAETAPDNGINAVFKSTNEGLSWTDMTTGKVDHDPNATFDNIPTDLAVSPLSPDTIYAAIGFRRSNGIWKSVNGGATWTKLKNGLPAAVPNNTGYNRIELAISPSHPNILYASYSDSSNNESLGIYKTTNGGSSWTKMATPLSTAQRNINDGRTTVLGEQGFYNNALAVHPTDPNTVFAGGIDIYRSTDGAASWTQVSMWVPGTSGFSYAHADQHVFAFFNGTNPPTIYVGNDGGVYRSLNNGTNWTELNNGLGVTQFYFLAAHPDDPLILLGGSQDNGSPMLLGGGINAWEDITTGDGGPAHFSEDELSTLYASIYNLNVYRFDGVNYATGRFPNPVAIGVNGNNIIDQTDVNGAAFFGPLEMSPNFSDILVLGTYRVLKTTNKGNQWTAISSALSSGSPIINLAIAPENDNVIWAATRDSRVFKTENNGASWSEVTPTGIERPNRFVSDIEFDPANATTVYLTYSGYTTAEYGKSLHVFRSTNAGGSWTNITNNLPDVPVNTLEVHPNNQNILVIGSDIGVFVSDDAGATWQPANNGFPTTQVVAVKINPGTDRIVVATHGRGIFDAPLSTVTASETPGEALPRAHTLYQNYPNPFNPSTTIAYELFKPGLVTLKIYDALGRESVTLLQDVRQPAGRRELSFDATGLASGIYFARLSVDGRVVGNTKMTFVK